LRGARFEAGGTGQHFRPHICLKGVLGQAAERGPGVAGDGDGDRSRFISKRTAPMT
jgi:hypothetical protein